MPRTEAASPQMFDSTAQFEALDTLYTTARAFRTRHALTTNLDYGGAADGALPNLLPSLRAG